MLLKRAFAKTAAGVEKTSTRNYNRDKAFYSNSLNKFSEGKIPPKLNLCRYVTFWCYFQILKKIGIKENPENGDSVLFRIALLLLYSASTVISVWSLWLSMVRMEMCCNLGANWANVLKLKSYDFKKCPRNDHDLF